ncbi:MAG: sodium-dependent transporter, partial [Bacteroidaceae bacterium]|nr:sodium-dependent transporter [Bacteroidaceae bacterium]
WSFGDWADVRIFGMGFFDLFDFLVAKLIMPVGGMLMCFFLGWVVDKRVLRAELTNGGTLRSPLYPVFRFIIRYFAPVCILLILVNELGLFAFLM